MNRSIPGSAGAILSLILVAACESTTQPDIPNFSSAIVYGIVVDEEGLPVSQAGILLEHRPEGCLGSRNEREATTTDESGFYRIIFALGSFILPTSCFVIQVIPPSGSALRFSPPISFVAPFESVLPRDSVQVNVTLTTAPSTDVPGELVRNGFEFSVELDPRVLPPSSPTAPFYEVIWRARNASPFTVQLDYCWLGIRLYSDSALVYEEPTFGNCIVSGADSLTPGSEQTISTQGGPDFIIEQGVPEGTLVLTARFHLPGMSDTLELRAGEVELIEHNGLTPAERPGTPTALFVSGRSQTQTGEPVPGFVNVGVHWEDCGRNPVIQWSTTTDVRGKFEQEIRVEEGVFEACISINVIPYTSFPEKTVELDLLTMQEPDSRGFPRDSLRVEIVF